MWILFAIGSSFFAGITAILAKCGIQKTDSDVATAVRTIVVLLFSWIVFHEKLTRKAAVGVVLITLGTVIMTMV